MRYRGETTRHARQSFQAISPFVCVLVCGVLCHVAGGRCSGESRPNAGLERSACCRRGDSATGARSQRGAGGAHDDEIRTRLEHILQATGWFKDPQVEVDEGVVFLKGTAAKQEYQDWAGRLAGNTQDVVAVVNQMEVAKPDVWNIRPVVAGLVELWTGLLHSLPFAFVGLVILLATLATARGTRNVFRHLLARRVEVALLREVLARACALAVLLLGLYVVLRVSGLTRLAITVIGGTGLLGLVIGIAFRDIVENFLASILLSVQRPFRSGDLVQVGDVTGIVERLNVRTTIIMMPDGNHAQIPNATVYKSVIRNYTSNPNRRDDFLVGIGYDASITTAQTIALETLSEHPAVLSDPEPWVLVDGLGTATVDLRVYYWTDGIKHSLPKVRSSIIRLIKRAFEDQGISMPDSAREILFPQGVPLHMADGKHDERNGSPAQENAQQPIRPKRTAEPVATKAEGQLASDARQIERQIRQAPSPEPGADLLQDAPTESAT